MNGHEHLSFNDRMIERRNTNANVNSLFSIKGPQGKEWLIDKERHSAQYEITYNNNTQ